jgi:hypothetical protein
VCSARIVEHDSAYMVGRSLTGEPPVERIVLLVIALRFLATNAVREAEMRAERFAGDVLKLHGRRVRELGELL